MQASPWSVRGRCRLAVTGRHGVRVATISISIIIAIIIIIVVVIIIISSLSDWICPVAALWVPYGCPACALWLPPMMPYGGASTGSSQHHGRLPP